QGLWRSLDVPDAANYSANARMRDGRSFEIRALKSEDQPAVLAAVARTSPQSLYRRFFGPKRYFSDQEIAYFMTVDFVNHVCPCHVDRRRWASRYLRRRTLHYPGTGQSGGILRGDRRVPAEKGWRRAYATYRWNCQPSGDQRVHGGSVARQYPDVESLRAEWITT